MGGDGGRHPWVHTRRRALVGSVVCVCRSGYRVRNLGTGRRGVDVLPRRHG